LSHIVFLIAPHVKDTQTEVSIIVPLLNEQESLPELIDQIESALGSYTKEVILVDDGSTDESWNVIVSLTKKFDWVKGVRFRRNFGKSAALQAGFDRAVGEFVVTMDADLQDDPNEVPGMIERIKAENLDLISGWKKKRYDPLGKTIPSKFFNYVTAKVSGIPLHDFNCGLKAYRSEVTKNVKLHGELHRYIPLLAKWEGYNRIDEQIVQHHRRKFGNTKFGLSRFVKGYLDLLTLIFIHRYMERPMHFFGTIGTISFLSGFGILAYLITIKLLYGAFLSNRPILVFAVLLVLLGAQSFSVGLLGELNKKENQRSSVYAIRAEAGQE
jgi:glycosyltransferase involved in cell wall biosynthesis